MTAAAPGRILVLIVDDHPLVRVGLHTRLAVVPYLDVVRDVGSGAEALEVIAREPVDLMLVDISMPGMNGVELVRCALELQPTLRVVVLSMFNSREYVLAAVRAGARGYVLKEAPVEETIAAIDTVWAGGTYYSAPVADHAIGQSVRTPDLTNREREVLLLVAHGDSNKVIARKLALGVRTVETHRLSLRRKLGIDSPSEFLKLAVMHGWTTL